MVILSGETLVLKCNLYYSWNILICLSQFISSSQNLLIIQDLNQNPSSGSLLGNKPNTEDPFLSTCPVLVIIICPVIPSLSCPTPHHHHLGEWNLVSFGACYSACLACWKTFKGVFVEWVKPSKATRARIHVCGSNRRFLSLHHLSC